MRRTAHQAIAAAVVTAALPMAVPGTALAQTQPVETETIETNRVAALDQIKRRATEAIDARLEAIARWTNHVESNEQLSADHRATLLQELSASAGGLTDLAGEIEGATTYSELGGLTPKIVEDHWVFALLGPKVHLVIAADVTAHVTGRFDETATSIQDAIDRLEESGHDPIDARAALERMQTHLIAASTLIEPVSASVLALHPDDMPEARTRLRAARVELESARHELRAARQAGREAVQAIRDALHP
ncbi:MAG: hypothetical protein ACXWH0_05735 [Acidimicrobiia bacterium]